MSDLTDSIRSTSPAEDAAHELAADALVAHAIRGALFDHHQLLRRSPSPAPPPAMNANDDNDNDAAHSFVADEVVGNSIRHVLTERASSQDRPAEKAEAAEEGAVGSKEKDKMVVARLYADDPTLTVLDLSGAFLASGNGDTALSTISDALNCSTHLRELNLSDNGITDVGVALLADALADGAAARGLTTVILDGNDIGTDGVNALVLALRQTPKTIFVSMERNRRPAGDVNAAALYQLEMMVRLNDQPGRLRQVVLDLIAENEVVRAQEEAHQRLYQLQLARVRAQEAAKELQQQQSLSVAGGAPAAVGSSLSVSSPPSSPSAPPAARKQQQQNTSSMSLQHQQQQQDQSRKAAEWRTKTLELDLSTAYARWPPPAALHNGSGSTGRISFSALFQQFLEILCTILASNRVLLKLSLAGNFIDDAGARTIARMLTQNRHLDELVLDGNSITDEGAQALVESFQGNNTLCVLSLLKNPSVSPQMTFDVEAAQALNRQPLLLKRYYYELLRDDPSVPEALDFDNRMSQKQYDDVGVRLMCIALERNTRVRSLTIVNAALTDTGCICLRDLLRRNKHLRRLAIKSCPSIGVDGVGRLCDMLSVNDQIESLALSDCDLDDEGALRIAAAVEQHPSLTDLDVSYNKRIVSSASAIATVFAHNYRLKNVNVEGTSCTESVKTAVHVRQKASAQPERLRALFGHLISNHWELTSVELRPSRPEDTLLDDTAIEMLAQALIDNTKVMHLDVSGNSMTLAGAKEIYRMLRLNRSTLRTLKMSDNRIDFGFQHAKLVAAVLGLHTVLHTVDISNTGMDDAGVEFMIGEIESFSNRIPVRRIDVSGNRLVSPEFESRLQLMLRAHALHPIVKRRFRTVHREWQLSDTERAPFRALKMGHVFDHAADYFDIPPPTDEDRIGCVSIAIDFVRNHAWRSVLALDVAGNLCTDAGIKLVADYVVWAAAAPRAVPIESINAAENALSDKGVEHLCRAAIACESIQAILAGGNGSALGGSVTDAALADLQARVSFNMQPEEMRRLIKHAEEGVTTTGADNNNTTSSKAGEIDESGRSIHHVNDTHVALLVRALKRKGAADVSSINFSNNYVSLVGLVHLFELAAERPALKKIVLRNTMIRGATAADAKPLAQHLLRAQLVHVDLSDNEFADPFAEALLPVLRGSKTLTHFSMNSSGLSAPVELAVASSVSLNALSSNLAAAGVSSAGGGSGKHHSKHHHRDGAGSVTSGVSSSQMTKPTTDEEEEEDDDGMMYLDDDDESSSLTGTGTTASQSQHDAMSVDSSLYARSHRSKNRHGGRRKIAISTEFLTPTHLKLGASALDERQIAEIVRMTRRKGTVTSIDVSSNKLLDVPLSQIVLLLVGYSGLQQLNISGNNCVGVHTVSKLRQLVQHAGCRLRELDLSHAIVGSNHNTTSSSSSAQSATTTAMTASAAVAAQSSRGSSASAEMERELSLLLSAAYDRGNTLWRVKFDGCEGALSEEAATKLTRLRLNRQLELKRALPLVLKNDPSLTVISALGADDTNNNNNANSRNVIDDVGMRFLCEALLHNTHVHKIELRIAEVSEAGIKCLEPVLATSAAVTAVSLVGSRLLRDGRCFADLIKVAKGLVELNIDDNALLPPQSLRDLASALSLRRNMRGCSVAGCCTERQVLLRQELEAAKRAYTANHMAFALEHGDVDLFRSDPEIQRLEREMREAAVRSRKYDVELSAAVEAVQNALFFNAHALTLIEFVEQEAQEQVIVARRAREARRAAGEIVTMNPEHLRVEREKEEAERRRVELEKQQALDPDALMALAEDTISASAMRRRERERSRFVGLRRYIYQEEGEPIPGALFSEPAVLTRLDLSRPQRQYPRRDGSAISVADQPPLEDHFIDDAAVKMLCALLARNDTVIYLSLARQELTALSAMALAEMLQTNRFIEQVDLSGNCMMDSVHHLCDALVRNPRLWRVDVSDNGTTDTLVHRIETLCRTNLEPFKFKELLVMIFEHRAEPRQVDLCFDDEQARVVAPRTLQEFPFKKERVDDVSAQMLCECGLGKCVSVRLLDVSRTHVGDDGMRHLLRTLTESRTIVTIHARGAVRMTDDAGTLLAQAWQDIPTLCEVDISGDDMAGIGDATVERAVASACAKHKCATFLVDGVPRVSARARSRLYTLCQVNRTFGKAAERAVLVECVMDTPARTEAALDALVSRGLMTSSGVTSSNSDVLRSLCTCVAMSRHVTNLSLEFNDLTDDALGPIAACLRECRALERLSLGSNKLVDVTALCHVLAPWMLEADEQEQQQQQRRGSKSTSSNISSSRFVDGSDAAAMSNSARGRASRAAQAVAAAVAAYEESERRKSGPATAGAAAAAAAEHEDDMSAAVAASRTGGGGSRQTMQRHAERLQRYKGQFPARLKSLHLHKNRLNVASAFAIADMLRCSDLLEELDLSENAWARIGGQVLASSLLVNPSVKRILLQGEGIPNSVLVQADSALSSALRATTL